MRVAVAAVTEAWFDLVLLALCESVEVVVAEDTSLDIEILNTRVRCEGVEL